MSESSPHREHIVVGYEADARGNAALEYACMLAASTDAEVIITMVLPEPNAFGTASVGTRVPEDHYYKAQLREWGDAALEQVPDGIDAWVDYRFDDSAAHGLIEAAKEHKATLIVIGSQVGPLLGRFTLGTVATNLLHASPLPVGLAPRGFKSPGKVTRINAVYGASEGAEVVIGRAVQRAIDRDTPLRLVSLVQIEHADPNEVRELTDEVRAYGGEKLEQAAKGMLDSGRATIEIAEGKNFAEGMRKIDWQDGDIAFVGSSRLGRGRGVFLGTKTRKVLAAIEVPVVVLPRDFPDPERQAE